MSDPIAAPMKLSTEDRRARLHQAINYYVPLGYRVINQTDATAQLVRPKQFSFLIAAFTFLCTFSVLFWLYILFFIAMKDAVMFIAVNEQGVVSYNGRVYTYTKSPSRFAAQLGDIRHALASTVAGQRLGELWNSGAGGKLSVLTGVGMLGLIVMFCCIGAFVLVNTNNSQVPRTSDRPPASGTQRSGEDIPTKAAPILEDETEVPTNIPPTKTMIPVATVEVGTKDNPAPWNTPIVLSGNSVMVTNVRLGVDAEIQTANMFNTEPEPSQQYIEVWITSECVDENCNISPYDFEVLGTKGIVYDVQGFLTGVDGMLELTEYVRGGKLENKKIFFIVATDDSNLTMQWGAPFSFDEGYFDLN